MAVLDFKPQMHPPQPAPNFRYQIMVFHPISAIAEILNIYYTLDPFGCKHLAVDAFVQNIKP
jgi:hypothetical protein